MVTRSSLDFKKISEAEYKEQAEKRGFKAIVITVDQPVQGNKRETTKRHITLPPDVR